MEVFINCITELIINQVLLDYVVIKLSESKTTKGTSTYYIITEGEEEVSEMLVLNYHLLLKIIT